MAAGKAYFVPTPSQFCPSGSHHMFKALFKKRPARNTIFCDQRHSRLHDIGGHVARKPPKGMRVMCVEDLVDRGEIDFVQT